MSNRLVHLDVFRCLAALVVVGAHSMITGYQLPYLQHVYTAPEFTVGPFNLGAPLFRGHLGVWIFYCISGYTMAMVAAQDAARGLYQPNDATGWRGYRSYFLVRRMLRLYPLFLVHLMVCSAFAHVAHAPLSDYLLAAAMVSNFWPQHITYPSSVMWSLVVEMQFYVLFALTYHWFQGRPRRLGFALALSLLTLALLPNIFWQPHTPWPLFILANNVPGFLSFFLLGILLHDQRELLANQLSQPRWAVPLLLGLVTALFIDTGNSLTSPANLSLLVITVVLAALTMVAGDGVIKRHPGLARTWLTQVLAFWGRASYSIYLFHTFAIIKIQAWLTPLLSPLQVAWCGFAGGVALGCLVYLLVEKPLQRLKAYLVRLAINPSSQPAAHYQSP